MDRRGVCVPGSTVLVAGPGADGEEVLGAVLVDCHVVAVEKTRYQYEKLQAHLLKMKDDLQKIEEAKQKEKEDEDEDEVPESQGYSAGGQYTQLVGSVQQVEKIPKCPTCGDDITEDPIPCTTPECTDQQASFHERCTVLIGGKRICVDCDRMRQDEASQAATQEQD